MLDTTNHSRQKLFLLRDLTVKKKKPNLYRDLLHGLAQYHPKKLSKKIVGPKQSGKEPFMRRGLNVFARRGKIAFLPGFSL